MTRTLIFLLGILAATPIFADPPQVENVTTERAGMGWRINVTLSHPDRGWNHFADGWEVLDADGRRLGYRELMHPHDHEQPFTRSLFNVMIPDGTRTVFIRARCSKSGWAETLTKVALRH